jgi:hypothetical protein
MNVTIKNALITLAIADIQLQQELAGKASYKAMTSKVREAAGAYHVEGEAAVFRAASLYSLSV